MKKTVNLIKLMIIIIGVIILAVCGYFFLRFKGKENLVIEEIKNTTDVNFLKVNNIRQLEESVKGTGIEIQLSDVDGLYSIGNAEILGEVLRVYYQTDQEGNFIRVDGSFSVELEKKDIISLQAAWSNFCGIVTDFFEVELVSGNLSYNVYASEGYEINAYAEESLKKVLKREAEFGLSVVDVDGTYWNASARLGENDVLQFEFFHSYEKGVYENGSENLVLSETAESEAEQ